MDTNVAVREWCKAKNEIDGVEVDIRLSDELLCNECWFASKHRDVIEEMEEDDNDHMDPECRDTIEPYCMERILTHMTRKYIKWKMTEMLSSQTPCQTQIRSWEKFASCTVKTL